MAGSTSTSVRDDTDDRRRAREQRGLASAAATKGDRLPPPPRERRPMLAALAVLLIVGGAAGAGLLALRADERVAVLVAAHDIGAGEVITEDALTTTSVASEGTRLIAGTQSDLIVGQYARVSIAEGQLLDTAMVTPTSVLGPGEVAVGASLANGRAPANGLEAGDIVQLVRVANGVGEVLVPDARVSSYRTPESSTNGSGVATVTFVVPDKDGAEVAAVAAAGELAVVLVQRGAALEN
jgi:SAF domain